MNSDLTRSLLAAVPMPLVLIGADARLAAVNGPAAVLLGTVPEGRHFTALLRAPPLVDCVETALRARRTTRARHVVPDPGGETVWQVQAEPVSGERGAGVLVSFVDVTALEAAGQMRRDFVANVSHELKTPLTALLGFIETLRGAARDDAAARARFLDIMAAEAERMNRLVSDLLSLNRVESDERVRPTARAELGPVVTRVVGALRPLAEERGMTVEVVGEAGPLEVVGDADQLVQVFTNLVENALKYAGNGRRVTLQVERVPHEAALRAPAARVAVIDDGEGFDPIHIPRLTERFYRIDSHRSRAQGGTGLGLAIVKHIVNRHRGRLRIDSAPGQGSRFTVTLPLAE